MVGSTGLYFNYASTFHFNMQKRKRVIAFEDATRAVYMLILSKSRGIYLNNTLYYL